MSANKEQMQGRRTTETLTLNASSFSQKIVESFDRKYRERMSAQEMDKSSSEILELQDNGEVLEDEEAQLDNLEHETDRSIKH